MPRGAKSSAENHSRETPEGPLVYGLFPAEFTYRMEGGVPTLHAPTSHVRKRGDFDRELERLGFPHIATAWGVDGADLSVRVFERHPLPRGTSPVAERILLIVELGCVTRYYLAPDLHDALPLMEQLANAASGMSHSLNALHRRDERMRREALVSALAEPFERTSKALRAYAEAHVLDDDLAMDAGDMPSIGENELPPGLSLGDGEPDVGAAEGILTEMLRRRGRQRRGNTND